MTPWMVGLSVIISLKDGKFPFHSPIDTLPYIFVSSAANDFLGAMQPLQIRLSVRPFVVF